MNATLTMPATVRELGEMAEARGMKASELWAELEEAGMLAHLATPQPAA